MKIDGNQLGGVPPESNISKTGPAGDAEGARRAARLGYRNSTDSASDTGFDGGSSDAVSISSLSQELSRVDSDREQKVDKLASLYDRGKLEVNSEQLAKKVVEDAFHSE